MAKRKKKKTAKKTATAEIDAAVAETSEATVGMDASIETAEDLAEQVHEEITKAELSAEEQQIFDALKGDPNCTLMRSGNVLNIYGPTAVDVKNASAKVWRVLGRLRREKKIDHYPEVNTFIAPK
jgi:hypothetical protein